MLRTIAVGILIGVACAVGATGTTAADDERDGFASNVLVTITVDESPGDTRAYRLVARGDDSDNRLMTGWRVPIPSSSVEAPGSQDTQARLVSSYTYQNVGLTAQLRAKVLPDERVVLRGDLEVSAAKESTGKRAGAAPTIGTFDQRFAVLLEDGEPLELAEVSSPEGGTLSIRVEARLMR